MTETTQVSLLISMGAPQDLSELMKRATSGLVFKKAGEAHPFLMKIISECIGQKSSSARIVCKDVAQEFDVSQPTMCHWNRKLVKAGLVTYKRCNKALLYKPALFLNPSDVFRCLIIDELKDRRNLMYQVLARVKELELQLKS